MNGWPALTHANLLYHLVFSTKNRQGYITPTLEEELYQRVGGIVRGIDYNEPYLWD